MEDQGDPLVLPRETLIPGEPNSHYPVPITTDVHDKPH